MAISDDRNPIADGQKHASAIPKMDREFRRFSDESGTSCYLIVEQQSRTVQAADRSARDYFKLGLEQLGSIPLTELFSKVCASEWDKLLDQNDKKSSVLITTHSSAPLDANKSLVISAFPLVGSRRETVLLNIQFGFPGHRDSKYLDALTGLPDRRELSLQFDELQRSGTNEIALLFLDLVHFKGINDKYGHPVGDKVLTEIAERWRQCLRDQDLVVRYGGDEFVVLLANIASPEAAQPVIERLVASASKPIAVGKTTLSVETTVGLALSSGTTQPIEDLIQAADRAMYAMKRTSN